MMQITPENYFEVWERMDTSALPAALVEGHKYLVDMVNEFGWRYLDEDDVSRDVFERQARGLAPYVKDAAAQVGREGKQSGKGKADDWMARHVHIVSVPDTFPPAGKETRSAAKPARKSQAAKPLPAKAEKGGAGTRGKGKGRQKAPKPASADVRLVRDLDVELQLMRRFVGLHGKAKTRKQVLALLAALNRAITKGHIRKTDNPTRFHEEMAYIQGRLAYALAHAFKKAKEGDAVLLEFKDDEIDRIKALVKSYAVYPSVRLALRFFAMEGKAPELAKARALLEQVRQAVASGKVGDGDPAFRLINRVEAALADYVAGGSGTVRVTDTTLEGLAGVVLGCPCKRRANAR